MSGLLTVHEQIRIRLDATQPRSIVERPDAEPGTLVASYRTEAQAHAAANAFNGRRPLFPEAARFLAFPLPGLCIEFHVTDTAPRHRLPGRPKTGPKSRTVLSGRHIDDTKAVA